MATPPSVCDTPDEVLTNVRSNRNEGPPALILSYKFRVYPNKAQAAALEAMLVDLCDLHNAALEQRITAWERCRVSLNYMAQVRELTALRAAIPELRRWGTTPEQRAIRRLEHAFQAFFRGEAGYPRFKTPARYNTIELGRACEIRRFLRKRKPALYKVNMRGIGFLNVEWHRPLPKTYKSAALTRRAGKWYISFRVAQPAPAKTSNAASVGLDMGLTNLVVLSTGEKIKRPNITKRNACKMRRLQRALARCKMGSKVRKRRVASLSKLHASIRNSRRDLLHKVSRNIVSRFGRIAVENLDIQPMRKGVLGKHVNDAAWGILIRFIDYKAANAGGEMKRVDPRGTSQTCPNCGQIAPKHLWERTHRCDCGCVLDRDVAAAMVIHYKAFGFWPGAGLGSLSVPAGA